MNFRLMAAALAASVVLPLGVANATDLEVTHWWTSGGEAAAVKEFAKAFDATGNHWVDGAIAGAGDTARPIMVSRITGGDPMGATQFNHGRQAEELVQAGLMRDLTDLATEGALDRLHPSGKPARPTARSTARSTAFPSTSTPGSGCGCRTRPSRRPACRFRRTGTNSSLRRPALEKAGIIPLAVGEQSWQTSGAFNVLMPAIGGKDIYLKVYKDKDATVAGGPEVAKVFKAADDARKMSAKSNVQDWNQATNLVITGKAGGQIMGDWAQGEFQVAGQVAGKDYTCLPGLGVNALISTGGDSSTSRCSRIREEQGAGSARLRDAVDPTTQVAFNLKKGSRAGARRRRPDGRQRLHEEGSRYPRQGQHHPRDRPADDRRYATRRSTICSRSSSPLRR